MPRHKEGPPAEINMRRAEAAIEALKDELCAQGFVVGPCTDFDWLESRELTERIAEVIQGVKGGAA